jgi:hypothetical protein
MQRFVTTTFEDGGARASTSSYKCFVHYGNHLSFAAEITPSIYKQGTKSN